MDWTTTGLWLAVLASGLYHGLNPAMGWPLAVSAGLMERNSRALFAAAGALWAGHLAAMLLVLLPFALLIALVQWQRQIQAGAALLVIGFGVALLVQRRHPRALARIPPSRLALWSFAVAIAHGAGLMLLPVYLGLCRAADLEAGHDAAATLTHAGLGASAVNASVVDTSLVSSSLVSSSLGIAVLVSLAHSAAMIAAGAALAWLVYRFLGLKFVARSWFNLDTVWAISLILVGALALAISVRG
jgi:hypothetical protein